ncbi:MAG: TIGR00730 family Rossman fold protein [Candidatus Nitrohelix vancouverensis]|uniref:AMP nucleosidase n=1 Tax=Candidatus Nitrohelix vancouverensis TaxID=2705534 RepID=A0A7T0G350_9BACT|nr:MAG: TIGR00730 family Rossman fold protein [Candidatus Nitrohelix vancouverensis]
MPPINDKFDPEKANQLIDELVALVGNHRCKEWLRQIISTVVKMGAEHDDRGDYKLMNTTVKELRRAFRIFIPYRETRKVSVFGSSRTPETDPAYHLAKAFAQKITSQGYMVVSGGGPGIMAAANEGAGRERSFGINIKLPFEQSANRFICDDVKSIHFKYFFTRKLFFIKESSATVVFPGGFGTLDEGFESLTLLQTGKCLPRPIILVEPEGGSYWSHWLNAIELSLSATGFISTNDSKLIRVTHSADEAAQMICDFYHVYHSLRYLHKQTLLKFTAPLPQNLIQYLNDTYSDLLSSGSIASADPFPEEIENDEDTELFRLVFHFDKISFGRLVEMIWDINAKMK